MLINSKREYDRMMVTLKSIIVSQNLDGLKLMCNELEENGICNKMINELRKSVVNDMQNGTQTSLNVFIACIHACLDECELITWDSFKI